MGAQDQSVRHFVIEDVEDGAPEVVERTTFKEIGATERRDIQRWIKQSPTIIGDELLIIGEEISSWTKSKDRPDLLAIDTSGKLVVIEIKRDDPDPDHHLQVLRYASYVSTLSVDQVVSIFAAFREKEGLGDGSESKASEILTEFTDGALAEVDEDEQPRMILVGASFRPEVMSTVLWLRKFGLDVGCIRIEPFRVEGQVVLSSSTLVPLPEANDYEIGLQAKRKSASAKKQPMDRQTAINFVASIPDGRWTSYGDIAAAAGNPKASMAVGSMLKQAAYEEVPLVYRVLNHTGEVNAGWTAEGSPLPQTPEEVVELLESEGVIFEDGKASQADRWRPEDRIDAGEEDLNTGA